MSQISIHKTHGKSSAESFLLNGYALEKVGRAGQGMPQLVENAKIALIDFPLRQHRMQLGVEIQISDAKELENVREKERDICKQKIEAIKASGANVIFTTGGLDDLALKYLIAANIFAVRRVSKKDMKRIESATGGSCVISMSTMENADAEVFPVDCLGTAGSVEEIKIGDWDSVVIRDCPSKACTIVCRGANEFMLDETERSIHDVLCILSKTFESKSVVAGGGAVEVALASHLATYANSIGSKEQSAVQAFAEALLLIPKQLCQNAAENSSDIVPTLRAHHVQGQERGKENADNYTTKFHGLNLQNDGVIGDNLEAGVIEVALSKKKAIKYACDTAISILRIDDIVRINPDPEPGR